MKTQLFIWGLLTIVGCSAKQDKIVDKKAREENKQVIQITVDKEDILYENELIHNFSSPGDKDTFKIQLTGQTIRDGKVKFQIITNSGQIILDETFPASMFLDYGLKEDANDNDKEEYIKGRIDKFFNTDNFHQPAIEKNDTYDEDYTPREIWDDIISDQTSIGFDYSIGEEDHRFIVYSKAQRKVVTYYNCC
jgi:hypothetical protein